MMDELQKEMDKNRFWVVKYNFLLTIVIFSLLILVLLFLEIGEMSVLEKIVSYYFSSE